MLRLLPSRYGDGKSSTPTSINGNKLRGARDVSLTVFGDTVIADPILTLINMQWGQIVAHDMSLTNLGRTCGIYLIISTSAPAKMEMKIFTFSKPINGSKCLAFLKCQK